MTALFNNTFKHLTILTLTSLFAENLLNFNQVIFSYITSCLTFGYRVSSYEFLYMENHVLCLVQIDHVNIVDQLNIFERKNEWHSANCSLNFSKVKDKNKVNKIGKTEYKQKSYISHWTEQSTYSVFFSAVRNICK